MASARAAGGRKRGMARLSMRALLVLVVLVPTLAMLVAAGTSVGSGWRDRRAAERLEVEVSHLTDIVDARAAVADEELASSLLVAAEAYGVDPAALEALYGVDYEAELLAARRAVDEDPTLSQSGSPSAPLVALREGVDDRSVSLEQLGVVMTELKGALDQLWEERAERFERSAALTTLQSDTRAQMDVLDQAFRLLRSANQRVELSRVLLTTEATDDEVAALYTAGGAYDAAAAFLDGRLGPQAAEVWAAFQADSTAQSFERTIDAAAAVGAAGTPALLDEDSAAFGRAFRGAAQWTQHITDLVRATAVDLLDQAHQDEVAATRTLVERAASGLAMALLSLAAAALLARVVVRPVRQLGAAAREVRDGRFEGTDLDRRGPRELADAADAFNEMSATLAEVEARAVMLAEDPGGSEPPDLLPGRTGKALHAAFDRLRASILIGERHRDELQELAVHDRLTGLLNRGAALDAVERELAGRERDGRRVMVLFVDLDGLKEVNDLHGHEAGDKALRAVADALRSTTRTADTVARYGGDEFLVSGVIDSPAEVDLLAERIRYAVAKSVVVWDGTRLPVTCSIGMAVSGPETATADGIISRADGALYEAKHAGKNRTAWPALASP